MSDTNYIKVWDPLVRFFHWSLVSAFTIAYITEDEWLSVHSWAGYLILGLLIIRFIWGFIGSRYARFSNFIYQRTVIVGFIKDSIHFKAKRYIGHNPAGGAMVIALMMSLFVTSITGVVLLGIAEQTGPLAQWYISAESFQAEILEEVHEFFANFTLLLVFIHVFGVIAESVIHKENLISSMLTGFKIKKNDSIEDQK